MNTFNRNFIAKHWYADIYEQLENETDDVEFVLDVLDKFDKERGKNKTPLKILEVACGGGRIAVPLAKAGYDVTGFDADAYMLLRCHKKSGNLPNIRCFEMNALERDWGESFGLSDVVVMAGNVLINIEYMSNDGNNNTYYSAQETFIRKAYGALKDGGHLYLDFDLAAKPEEIFHGLGEGSYFDGTDDMGTYGRTMTYGSVYNPATQICTGSNHTELTLANGEKFVSPRLWHKHIPTQAQVYGWLENAGFVIEKTFKDFSREPIENPVTENCRATIWARRD